MKALLKGPWPILSNFMRRRRELGRIFSFFQDFEASVGIECFCAKEFLAEGKWCSNCQERCSWNAVNPNPIIMVNIFRYELYFKRTSFNLYCVELTKISGLYFSNSFQYLCQIVLTTRSKIDMPVHGHV